MKKLLFLALITVVTLFSCSKKSNLSPQSTNTVTINGTTYTTVSIGTQTWTSVNYNGTGGVNYNNSSTNNPTYGRLYTLAEAQAISLPTGWRLPTLNDAVKLLLSVGGTPNGNIVDGLNDVSTNSTANQTLKSKSDWKYTEGSNSSGFNAYPTGTGATGGNITTPVYSGIGESTEFWTSTIDINSQYLLLIADAPDGPTIDDSSGIDYTYPPYSSTSRYSIRFVRDN